ncbi:hypothetical protein [Providencia heimbachae]|uniref:Uncharacterized protein n=1 Tax=Providencia heimbachae ATCC 35613 TaxID=1354272 RepID=A0A1B7JGL7_9GAMM|nr:hypothetical protein [Providencia heimbachae]OAT46996.1 hypothetical protein M998_3799 [Providencia heimbachae ATCC 35613]SQH13015.1 Uncharacterised protein [Providencia heimbachae]
MSDKKEIATLSIKMSVDSTDLDKLEAQLKRIEGLMVSTGLKQSTSVGFSADKFFVTNGQVFIDEAFIDKAAIEKIAIQSPTTTIRTGVCYDDKKQSTHAQLDPDSIKSKDFDAKVAHRICGISIMHDGSILFGSEGYMGRESSDAAIALKSSAAITRLEKTISHEESEFEKLNRMVEDKFSQLQSSITAMQCTQAASEQAIDDAMQQAAKEGARKGVKQVLSKITAKVNDQ